MSNLKQPILNPEQCPVCDFDGIVNSEDIEYKNKQSVDFWCERCGLEWQVEIIMSTRIILPKELENK